LNILDTGIGIRKEILEKIFDPYFTTKEKEKGTGLGLSVVQGIVKSCKGHVQVDSEPDAGTNFHVYLPIIALDYDSKEIGEAPVMVGGTEKILVVDDEEMIALVTQRLLERLGYKVTIRVSSLEALAAFKAAPDRFDLVITDMTMPQMTGDILVRELKKIRPGIPIIMCTGFSERIKAEDLKAIGIASFLMKPLNSAVLSLTVREILDQTLSG
jgi:CheY-like chemotaxis protein